MKPDINLSMNTKNDFDKNMGTHRNTKKLCSTFILIVLILPVNDKGNKFQCSRSCLRLCNKGGKLALKISLKAGVIQIPKYLNFCVLILNGNKPKSMSLAAGFTGMISLFCRLILYPDILLNSSSRVRVFGKLAKGETGTKACHQHKGKPYFQSRFFVFPLYRLRCATQFLMALLRLWWRGKKEKDCYLSGLPLS